MDDPEAPSPFAAFAAPKKSAVEEYQERTRRAQRAMRWMLGCVLAGLAGAIAGATGCAAFDGPLDALPSILIGASCGSLLGTAVGWLLGAACFGAMQMAKQRVPAQSAVPPSRDPMAILKGLMFAWSLIGLAIGASEGAQAGVHWAGGKAGPWEQWTIVGSLAGAAFAIGLLGLMSKARSTDK
ncbi:MAG TPA: hypothetical protein VGI99_10655 [Gemmataceae bacterium]